MKSYSDIRRALAGKLWFIHEAKLNEMLALLEVKLASGVMPEVRASSSQAAIRTAKTTGAIACIPIYGLITHRASMWSYLLGGASTQNLSATLRQAVADPYVSAIVLDVDSPGGDVDGIDELASEIYQARKQKPITAVSNCLCASAAYYLASQASEIIASPSSLTGSVGVYHLHADRSAALDNAGVKMSMIKYGDNKCEGNPYEPLSDPAREQLQNLVNTYGRAFEAAVARGRGIKQSDVHNKFGQGRVFDAKTAVRLGMADRVGTLADALQTSQTSARGRAQAQLAARRQPRSLEFARMRHQLAMAAAGDPLMLTAGTKKKTKRVDGEDLEKEAFAYRPTDELSDWKLPIKFSTDEKTKSHIRNAISRWSSTDMPDADEKSKARSRIKAAAKKYGIDVDDDSLSGRAQPPKRAGDGDDDDCLCDCVPCDGGDCEGCDCDACECEGCDCESAVAAAKRKAEHARMRHQLAVAGA